MKMGLRIMVGSRTFENQDRRAVTEIRNLGNSRSLVHHVVEVYTSQSSGAENYEGVGRNWITWEVTSLYYSDRSIFIEYWVLQRIPTSNTDWGCKAVAA
jgi:hypothetical protein